MQSQPPSSGPLTGASASVAVAVIACALIAGAPTALAATTDASTEGQPSAIFVLVMAGLAGILIGMGYGAMRAVVRRIRARRRSTRADRPAGTSDPTS